MLEVCPQCDVAIPQDAPEGVCPRCLAGLGFQDVQSIAVGSAGNLADISPPTPASLTEDLPHLEVLELVGRGGMGAVYKARQTHLDRIVAIKVLLDSVASAPEFAERFAREARAVAKLVHPNIAIVFDCHAMGKLPYLVMEYVDGINLRHAIQTSELQAEQVIAIIPQICDGLQFAHEHGVVHRDVKPENILLDEGGRVKIVDFGLARLSESDDPQFTLTGGEQRLGTPHYMAPEQMHRPDTVDHRADIYSLGVVIYELLTGELPLGRFSPPSEHADIDPRLDDVVHKALENEPSKRYQSASDFKKDVISILETPVRTHEVTTIAPNSR